MGGEGKVQRRRFAEKVRLAVESSQQSNPASGTSGLEVELNILGGDLQPVASVGSGPESRSFADFLHDERLPEWARKSYQLEVFHWMTELTTEPHFSAFSTAAEARLLEAVLINTLAELELSYGEPFGALHGNIPLPLHVGPESIPRGWNLARRRYLERCVALFGPRLATAGVHTNHSYPEALISWDFLHLPLAERKRSTIDDYRNWAVIRATRLLRPYCPLFIAISAASPLAWEEIDGTGRPVLTDIDSQRLHAFPNPQDLDVGGLYTSHEDYLRISYDLVRRGVRFGANNWTPVRARSDVDPVRRNILATSEQLRDLYRRGIYAPGENSTLEETERDLIVENLCARVDLPMNRVEVRTDEGGDTFELSVAKVLFKELLMLRFYGDHELGSNYRYTDDDVKRARKDEAAAARHGLEAVVSRPFGDDRVSVRELLGATLTDLDPMVEVLGCGEALEPLREMAGGGDNPAVSLRRWMMKRLNKARRAPSGSPVVPADLLREYMGNRRSDIKAEIEMLAASDEVGNTSSKVFSTLLMGLDRMARQQPAMPIRLSRPEPVLEVAGYADRVREIVRLSAELIRIPSVTNCPDERLDEVSVAARFIAGWLRDAGLEVKLFEDAKYPSLVAGFPEALLAPVSLSGHFDVVPPEPDDRQFEPRVDGDYLWGRGAADMKTVVASYMFWLRAAIQSGPPYPPINLILVGNEENGESEAWGTPHVLAHLRTSYGWEPEIMLVGERTGEEGHELIGSVCPENRGVARMRFIARGQKGHTGTSAVPIDLLDRLVELKTVVSQVFPRLLTLSSLDGWETGARFPFLNVGENGVFNITAGVGVLGLEVRPIPSDDLMGMVNELRGLCRELDIELDVEVLEAGIACPSDNLHLKRLIDSVAAVSGTATVIGKKKPGSSARFAPGGNAVVWGQTGIGPHSKEERHFIPSIEPYLDAMDEFARRSLSD
jgi:succinyl-diaminopimelate desuccinylase